MAPDVRAVADVSSVVGRYYDKLMLERLVANTVLYNMSEKRSIPKGAGNVIYMNRFTNFPTTTTKLTEGIVPTQTYLSGTEVYATLYQLGGWTPVSDVLVATSFSQVVKECVENFGDSAATSVDTSVEYDLLSEDRVDGGEGPQTDDLCISTWWFGKQGGLSTLYISSNGTFLTEALTYSLLSADVTGTEGHVMDIDKIVRTVGKLRNSNVRPFQDGYYKAWAHPKVLLQIQRTAEWAEFNKYTRPEILDRGEVGRVAGVRFYESTIPFITNSAPLSAASTSISLAFTLIWGKGAFAVTELSSEKGVKTYVKAPNNNDTSNPINQWSTVGWKILMAAKVLNKSCGYFLMSITT